MKPVEFPEANTSFGPPKDLAESQCKTVRGYSGVLAGGSCDGAPITVVAWKPSSEELTALNNGSPVFLSVMGGLFPHYVCTSFTEAINVL
jgi:hypothetical protein